MIAIGVHTRYIPEKKILAISMLLSIKVCYPSIVLEK